MRMTMGSGQRSKGVHVGKLFLRIMWTAGLYEALFQAEENMQDVYFSHNGLGTDMVLCESLHSAVYCAAQCS